MPRGVPVAGFRRTKNYTAQSIQEIEADLQAKAPRIIDELERLTKPIPCPHCGNKISVIDKDVGMYLLNRAMGMPKQRQELDITQSFQLSADQIDVLIERHLPALAVLVAERYHLALPEPIEGEFKEV